MNNDYNLNNLKNIKNVNNKGVGSPFYYDAVDKVGKQKKEKKKLNNANKSTYNSNNNKKSISTDLNYTDMMENAKEDRKVRKFMYIALPIIILEIAAIIGVIVFLLVLPKNFCKISTNYENAEIYVNNKKTNRFRFTKPEMESTYYYYGVDVSIELPDGAEYNVTYTLKSDYCEVHANTIAPNTEGVYSLKIKGGERTTLLNGIYLKSDKNIKKLSVKLAVDVVKL